MSARLAIVALASVLIPTTAPAQIKTNKTYNIHDPIVVSCNVELDKSVSPVYLWKIEEPAKSIVIDDGKTAHIWAPVGEYSVTCNVITINWETRHVGQVQFVERFVVGQPQPPLPPAPPNPPQPPVPPDEFGNVGQEVAKWAIEYSLDKTQAVAANYETAARRLSGEQTPIIPTIDAAVTFVSQENDKIDRNKGAWESWAFRVNDYWKRYVNDRGTASRFFLAVSAGLKGV